MKNASKGLATLAVFCGSFTQCARPFGQTFFFSFCLRLREISCSIAVGLCKSFRVESDRVGARGNFHVYFVVFFMIPHFAG